MCAADIATVGLPTQAVAHVSRVVDASWIAFACAAESKLAATAAFELAEGADSEIDGCDETDWDENWLVEWCITCKLTWPVAGPERVENGRFGARTPRDVGRRLSARGRVPQYRGDPHIGQAHSMREQAEFRVSRPFRCEGPQS